MLPACPVWSVSVPLLISPDRLPLASHQRVVFLAGSIEMGKADDWQSLLAEYLLAADPGLIVANPRRAFWDSTWEQSIHNPDFSDQVNWELDHLERSDLAVFYFQPDTLSPITLMELGARLAGPKAKATVVCCPPGFWRRGNIEIMCDRAGLAAPLESFSELLDYAQLWAQSS